MDNPNPENTNAPEKNPEQKPFLSVLIHSFFIVPFLIAVFCVLLFTAINLLTREEKTVYDHIEDVKVGGLNKRWQAAFELSKVLASPGPIIEEERFQAEMINAFEKSVHDDDRVRQYLALAMGRTQKEEFFKPLISNINNEKEQNLYAIIYALGMLQDKRGADVLKPYVDHNSARIRSMTVVALGNIGNEKSKNILKKALNDPEANVQWGSAISLAKMKDASGKGVIAQLLSRSYLNNYPEVDTKEQNHLILAAIEAAQILQEGDFDKLIAQLTDDDNMKVRAAAMNYFNRKGN